ncbi:MAG: 23S rRNA (adenine(2030)-N(6))-methyltransferase RlmJ [Rubrivivax sp.]|nr:MAG: 23S rRNA (adenine(2030)-N(6))-methyltransferase RlmJ [Rubrivivax sp.]
MLSYQHAYHVGGPADVIKHALWAHVLAHLAKKDGALHIHETHSGRGIYDVSAPETQKTPEYRDGIARLFGAEPTSPYLQAVHALNSTTKKGNLSLIPGSPAVAAHLLRAEDHLHLIEAHPNEIEHLYTSFPHATRREKNIHVHHADGHKHITNLIRGANRNAVLIDPSYEVKTEYQQTIDTVAAILKQAPRATVMVWYPLLSNKKLSQSLIDGLKDLGVPATYLVHYTWQTPEFDGMHGTGQIILNLPYKMEADLPALLKPLAQPLKQKIGQLTTTLLVPRT